MADEWIKYRDGLRTHPRFLALFNRLVQDGGILRYVCPPCHESHEPSRRVTDSALRDVTHVTLLRVWCAVNAHCRVSGVDAVMVPMGLPDLDMIAGFTGFAEAMSAAGWVRADATTASLIFPNFLEFNEPACLRKREPKSDAQRQRECRARKKGAARKDGHPGVSRNVTHVTKSHAREEKRREEKREDKETPTPLESKPNPTPKTSAEAIPPALDSEAFRKAWGDYLNYRREIKKRLTPTGIKALLKKLEPWGEARATAALAHSMASGWQGVFEPKDDAPVGGASRPTGSRFASFFNEDGGIKR